MGMKEIKEMYREGYGEYWYWSQGVMGSSGKTFPSPGYSTKEESTISMRHNFN